jgi:hypothetical protein
LYKNKKYIIFFDKVGGVYIQGVSKTHRITSGMSSSYVDRKNSLYQNRCGTA